MEIICRILPICFPNLPPGCSIFDYILKCCHIFCSVVAGRGFESEAGQAERLISIVKAGDLSQRCAAAPSHHGCRSLHEQAAGTGCLPICSWVAHTSPQQPCQGHGAVQTTALLLAEETSSAFLQGSVLVSPSQLHLCPIAQVTPYSMLIS